jgi:hypothetical protein
MRKNVIVAILLLGLLAALASPATGARRKKKKVKPYKSETVSIAAGHPVFHGASEGNLASVTAQEFFQTCAVPGSNGLDAWVFTVPKAYTKLVAAIEAKATSASPVPIDMDLYFYNKACDEVGFANAEAPGGESGIIPKGTSFVLMHPYTGAPVDGYITLKPYKSSF